MPKAKQSWLGKLQDVPKHVLGLLKGKAESLALAVQKAPTAQDLVMQKASLQRVRERLRKLSMESGAVVHKLSAEEHALAETIRRDTERRNRSNVSRTAAYWDIFHRYPELHWAFLAHMVSRNGGWSMTDLKGDLLPRLLDGQQAEAIFRFLERANALIFQDAYPQLLLYAESRRRKRSLFHMLPEFRVTRFMKPVWEQFWERGDSVLLTVALIVNEQHYIEKRVVQQPFFQQNVLHTLAFKTQSMLQLNQIVFPYGADAQEGQERHRLAGLIMENFGDLHERIEIGKKLYAILFGLPDVKSGAQAFARRTPHTGSRADFWPHIFTAVRHKPPLPDKAYSAKLDGCQTAEGAERLFSPKLSDAWKDRPVEPAEEGDWFRELSVLSYFTETLHPPFSFDMTQEYCFGLNKIELAVLAKQELL
jgi:hypothetical protein